MRETDMGYRGSKSGISLVKEQRVDGSWFLAQQARNLRYTLIETISVLYLKFYLTKLEQKNSSSEFTNRNKTKKNKNNQS
jgi:hypothetical protein